MSASIKASIIICTRNRAEDLRQTLANLGRLDVPADLPAELVVVNNGSTDHTSQVVRECGLTNMPVREVVEPRPGAARARNAGMAAARGEIILFTDDDVRCPAPWLRIMCEPILSGRYDAVSSDLVAPEHLRRPWMEKIHYEWLAVYQEYRFQPQREFMVSASMAMSRKVLERVPAFDPELGPGALGHAEDTLFSMQVQQAGFRIGSADVIVEHHFDESRLTRGWFLNAAKRRGEMAGYLHWHFFHTIIRYPRLGLLRAAGRLAWWRLRHWRRSFFAPLPPGEELVLRIDVHSYKQFLRERRRPKLYAMMGAVKLDGKARGVGSPERCELSAAGALTGRA